MPNYYSQDSSMNSEEETWDLRQFYTRYLSLYMLDYKLAMDIKDYTKALSVLDQWHAFVHGRVVKKFLVDGHVVPDEHYNNLRTILVNLSNEYKIAYLGKSREPQAIHKIEMAFKEIVMALVSKMDAHELFGKRRDLRGL